jgi:hypothetical protein
MTPVRAGAALAMLVAAGAIYGLAATEAFGFSTLRIQGTTIIADAEIERRLALIGGQNLFQVESDPLEARIREIPAVASVDISIALPDTVVVDVAERRPTLVWQVGERSFLVDAEGILFAERGDPIPPAVADLPVVVDERMASHALQVAGTIDPVDLDVASRLASLTPAQLGSAAADLDIGVTDENGFVVRSTPKGWTAIFGFYGLSLRTPDIIPGQVQVLTRLLAQAGESTVDKAILADDRDGTFIPRATPKPSATPKP